MLKIKLLLIVLVLTAMGYGQDTYLDQFNSSSYSNNDGTANFSSNWSEINEATSPTGGRIRIPNGQPLRFRRLDNRGIQRGLDLSGAASVVLTLDYQRTNGDESIAVQLFDGSAFNTVAILNGTGSVNYTLATAEISNLSAIRFVSASGTWSNGETIFVDNVLFTATLSGSSDGDNDGILDGVDNCPNNFNPSQADNDGDGIGDLCDTDDDNDGIIDALECGQSAATINSSFELPIYIEDTDPANPPTPADLNPTATVAFRFAGTFDESLVLGWSTTATDDQIEIGRSGNLTPFRGGQYAELNANENAALFQDIQTVPGSTVFYSFAHRGRSSAIIGDVMQLLVGDPSGTLSVIETVTSTNVDWTFVEGSFVVPAGQTKTRIQFEAVSTADANNASGNLLDAISFFACVADSDLDGVLDANDLDSDNDGILDAVEYGVDTSAVDFTQDADGDRIPDAMDMDVTGGVDSNGNGVDDAFEPRDSDSDGLPDYLDKDSDGDGCNDVIEANFTDPDGDGAIGGRPITVDGNGMVTGAGGYTGTTPGVTDASLVAAVCDTDNDGISALLDADDDNDGILDAEECPNTVLWVTDDAASITSEEANTISKLQALGYVVTVVSQNTVHDANNYGVTFLYEDVASDTALANIMNIATTTRGVITSENALHDDLLGSSAGGDDTTSFVEITDNTHPITLGLPLGDYNIGDASFHANADLTSGTVLGLNADNGLRAMVVWEVGDALNVGTAPGRRAIVPHSNQLGVGFNAAGEDLLVNAIIWTAGVDTDLDGINDHLDLDSDNDGIYDAVEAGHGQPHTNGRVDGAVGTDGVPNAVQASGQENSSTINYTVLDSDTDTILDYRELDSDDDGCNDVTEAGFTDDDSDGQLGPAALTVDGNGVVTSGSDGYTVPADGDSNSTFDYREFTNAPAITGQPTDFVGPPGCDATFTATVTDVDTYQWQTFNGTIWVDLTDTAPFSGTTTATLQITNAPPTLNGAQYRVVVSNTAYVCSDDTSNSADLNFQVATVITNRRITYRVNKN